MVAESPDPADLRDALRESDERYRFLAETIPVQIWTAGPDGQLDYVTEKTARSFGLTAAQLLRDGWKDVVHPDDLALAVERWTHALTTGEPYAVEFRLKLASGAYAWHLAQAVAQRRQDGAIVRWFGTNTNIAEQREERRRVQSLLDEVARLAADSERQRRVYETVLTNTPDFVYVFSLDHKVLYANESLIQMWGRGRDGAIGKTFLEIGYEPWHAAMHDQEIDQVRATRQSIRGEVPFSGTNGRRQYDYIFVPVIGADGEVEAVAGTTRDVTERKEKEKQLREGQEQLDFALAAADLGQWALNLTDLTVRRTLRHDQLFGYDALLPRWTYEMFLKHVVPADRAAVDASFHKSVATGAPWAAECRIRRADGALRHVWMKGLVRRDAEGRVEQMLGIIGDITDLRQAEDRQAFLSQLADGLRPLSDPIHVQAESSRVLGQRLAANRVAYFEVRGEDYVVERDYTDGVSSIVGHYPIASFGPELLARYRAGHTAVEKDVDTMTSLSRGEREAFASLQIRSYVAVPLVKGGVFVAGLAVHAASVREWTPTEVAIVQETAERTWAAVERVRAEAALRQSEERSAFVRRSSGVGFWYCDLPFDVLQWDDLVKAHFHLPPDATVTIQTFYDRIHPDDREPTRLAIERSIAERTPYKVDYRTVEPDTGVVTWVRAIGRTSYAADGSPSQFDGVTFDVSDQKRAEASLAESEARFRQLAESLPQLVWTCRGDGYCDYLGPQWVAYTGVPEAQQHGSGWLEQVHPEDRDRVVADWNEAVRHGTRLDVEFRIRRHDGVHRWFRTRALPFRDESGRISKWLGSNTDTDDAKRVVQELAKNEKRERSAREQAERAAKFAELFVAVLGHDLRNPLGAIQSGGQILERTAIDQRQRSAAARILSSSRRMARMIEQILDFSRIRAGSGLHHELREVDLSELLSRVVDELTSDGERVARISTEILGDARGHWDEDRLAQVLSNLLGNALEHSPQEAPVRIALDGRDADRVVVRVQNEGAIPAELLPQLFEPFRQGRHHTKSRGLGLGLYITKEIAQTHGATIDVASSEERGTMFEIVLPRGNDTDRREVVE